MIKFKTDGEMIELDHHWLFLHAKACQEELATLRATNQNLVTALTGLVAQLPQPNLDDPDLDTAIDLANTTLAQID